MGPVEPVDEVLFEQGALRSAACRPADRGSIRPHPDGHRLAFLADDPTPEMGRDQPEVDEPRLLIAERLDEARLLVRAGAYREDAQVRRRLGGSAANVQPHDLVVHRIVDLEGKAKAEREEPRLLVDLGRAGHQIDVLPDRDDRRLDRGIGMAGRSSSADDHALEPRHVTSRPSQPTTELDELIGVEPGREPARHDAQDHPADTIPQGWRGAARVRHQELHNTCA